MPPAISDDESDDIDVPDFIPAKPATPKGKGAKVEEPEDQPDEDEEAEDDDDDGEEDGDEYRVEKVLKHDYSDAGVLIYLIKWQGYEKKSDQTWEPLENLEGAKQCLDDYHHRIGGTPEPVAESASSKKKGSPRKGAKRNASEAFADSPAPVQSEPKKRGRKSAGRDTNGEAKQRDLPEGTWETHIKHVNSILQSEETEEGGNKSKTAKRLVGLVEWKDGGKTQHNMGTLRRKCPQKVLDYYENHLVFRGAEDVMEE